VPRLTSLLDHFQHPRLVIWALATLSAVAGFLTHFYDSLLVSFSTAWSIFAACSAAAGYITTVRPTRTWVAVSGAALTVVFLTRGAVLLEAAARRTEPATHIASLVIGGTQWVALAYLTWVVWRRLIIPWSVITEER
jgi:hypothetical protein